MFLNLKRHLMTEVDSGSGNGAAPPTTPAPVDVSQAQGTPVITKEIADVIASSVSKAVADVKDSIFAEARRTFTESKKTKTKTDDAPAPLATQPALDPIRLRSLDRELNKAGLAPKLSDSQYQRVEKMFAIESPDDVAGWVKDYFDGWGNAAAPQAAPPVTQPVTQTAPQQRTSPPVSDRGSPPVSSVPLDEQDIFAMSPSDREALRRSKGEKWFTDKILEQSKRHTYKLR